MVSELAGLDAATVGVVAVTIVPTFTESCARDMGVCPPSVVFAFEVSGGEVSGERGAGVVFVEPRRDEPGRAAGDPG